MVSSADDDSCSISMEVGEGGSDITSKDDIATPTPHDPLKGLPQLFRQRGFSSDFSEDGDMSSSRRNSTSEGGVITTPLQPNTPDVPSQAEASALKPGSDVRVGKTLGSGSAPEESAFRSVKVGQGGTVSIEGVQSLSAGQPVVKFASARTLTEDATPSDLQPSEVVKKASTEISKSILQTSPQLEEHGSAATVLSKPAQAFALPPLLPPSQPPRTSRHGRGIQLPPPLRLMSPTSEPVIPAFQASQPRNLSPIARSPGNGRIIRFGMPILSPLHTPPVRPALPPPLMLRQEYVDIGEATPISPTRTNPYTPGGLKGSMLAHLAQQAAPVGLAAPHTSATATMPISNTPSLPTKPVPPTTSLREVRPEPESAQSSDIFPSSKTQEVSLPSVAVSKTENEPEQIFKRPGTTAITTTTGSPNRTLSPHKIPLKGFSLNLTRSPSMSSLSSKGSTPSPSPEKKSSTDLQPEKLDRVVQVHRKASIGKQVNVDPDENEEVTEKSDSTSSPSSASTPSPSVPTSVSGQVRGGKSLSVLPISKEDRDTLSSEPVQEEEEEEGGRRKVGGAKVMMEHSPISSEDGDKEGFCFEQEMIPDRLSLSPAPHSLQIPATPTFRGSPPTVEDGDGITEEVATLDSGVGGVTGGVVEGDDVSLADSRDDVIIGDIMREDDIVQTVVSRGSPPVNDDDDVIVQSSAKGHLSQGDRPLDDDDIIQSSTNDHAQRAALEVSQEVLEVLGQPLSSDDSEDTDSESAESDEPSKESTLGPVQDVVSRSLRKGVVEGLKVDVKETEPKKRKLVVSDVSARRNLHPKKMTGSSDKVCV